MSTREKILVVDDEEQICQLLRDLLEDYHVHTVGSVDMAMEALIQENFDLVITDLKMPDRSGLDIVKDVMAYASNTPVIVMSGHGGKKETTECLRYGACDYFEKPWDCDEVLLSTRRALDRSATQKHKEQLLLQLKVKNDELLKLNRILLQEKKDRENYKFKKYYQRIIGHDIKNIFNLIHTSIYEQNLSQAKIGLSLLKNLIPLSLQWEQIIKVNKICPLVEVKIDPIVEKALVLFEQKIHEKKIRIIKNDLIHTILGEEPILVHFVLNNILENSIKYSPIGHDIFITGSIEENSIFKLTIEDHGVGIPKEFMDSLTDLERPQLREGTMGEKGIGGGLNMVHLAMEYLRAKWEIIPMALIDNSEESDESLGTQVNLYFTLVS